jgi:DNA-binding CsgD family transcriptional regulator
MFPIVLIPKVCSRCHAQFNTSGLEGICPTCRCINKRVKVVKLRGAILPSVTISKLREDQIICGLLAAKENKEIAFDTGLTEGTVKQYLHVLFRKYKVTNRVGLVLLHLKSMG